jgi:hypothetical protein
MDYPWYVEVSADASLTQGDLVESCPVLVFDEVPNLGNHQTAEALLAELDKAHAVQMVRAIVMTQACDLEHRNVRNVILCPIYNLDEYKRYWEEKRRQAGKSASTASWDGHIKQMKDGKIWNLTMLQKWDASGSGVLSIPHQVVDFHEVFSLPLDFLFAWLRSKNEPRLRLRPPYREHLSQAFARFFMRVGLPDDITL